MNNKMAINTYLSTNECKKQNKITEQAEQKQTHRENILMAARWGGGWEGG